HNKEAILTSHLRDNYPSAIANLAGRKWNWSDQASKAGLQKHYDFIYRLTSRMLHSTPQNIVTEKTLTESERLLVMDYHVVAGGDLLREIEIFDYPGRAAALAVEIE